MCRLYAVNLRFRQKFTAFEFIFSPSRFIRWRGARCKLAANLLPSISIRRFANCRRTSSCDRGSKTATESGQIKCSNNTLQYQHIIIAIVSKLFHTSVVLNQPVVTANEKIHSCDTFLRSSLQFSLYNLFICVLFASNSKATVCALLLRVTYLYWSTFCKSHINKIQ